MSRLQSWLEATPTAQEAAANAKGYLVTSFVVFGVLGLWFVFALWDLFWGAGAIESSLAGVPLLLAAVGMGLRYAAGYWRDRYHRLAD